MIPLSWFLILGAALFFIGLFGVLTRKNLVAMLMGAELMINAVMLTLLSFWRYLYAPDMSAMVFVAILFAAAAADTAVGLALIISIYRRRQTVVAENINSMKG